MITGNILKEILHRKFNFFFILLALTLSVSVFVMITICGKAYTRETGRIMRNMGQNLRIISKEADISDFWANDYVSDKNATMPVEYIQRFEKENKWYHYTHLTAELQYKYEFRGGTVFLTGMHPFMPGYKAKQKNMIIPVEIGEVNLGYQVYQQLGIEVGDEIEIEGKSFKVAKCLVRSGSRDDIRIYTHLKDAQEIFNMPGRINEIKALECACMGKPEDRDYSWDIARHELSELLPEAQVFLAEEMAAIRIQQRTTADTYIMYFAPIVLIACGALVAVLFMLNVRDRKQEVGIMRSIGYGGGRIAWLFIGKALLIGFIASGCGYYLGEYLARQYGMEVFPLTGKKSLLGDYSTLKLYVIILTPLFASVASFIPAILAVSQDPAQTLRQD